jgi:hypothetical protein
VDGGSGVDGTEGEGQLELQSGFNDQRLSSPHHWSSTDTRTTGSMDNIERMEHNTVGVYKRSK